MSSRRVPSSGSPRFTGRVACGRLAEGASLGARRQAHHNGGTCRRGYCPPRLPGSLLALRGSATSGGGRGVGYTGGGGETCRGMTACPAKASDCRGPRSRRLTNPIAASRRIRVPPPVGLSSVPADPIPTEWVDEQGRGFPSWIPAEWADPEGNVVSFVTRDAGDYTSAMKALSDPVAAENPEWLVDQRRRPGSDPGALRSGGSGGQTSPPIWRIREGNPAGFITRNRLDHARPHATDPPCSGKPSDE